MVGKVSLRKLGEKNGLFGSLLTGNGHQRASNYTIDCVKYTIIFLFYLFASLRCERRAARQALSAAVLT
jgi:hypothetical protein